MITGSCSIFLIKMVLHTAGSSIRMTAASVWHTKRRSEFHSAFSHSDNFNLLMTVSYGLDVFRPAIILIMDHNRRSHFQHIIQSRRLIKRHIDTAVGTDSRRLIQSTAKGRLPCSVMEADPAPCHPHPVAYRRPLRRLPRSRIRSTGQHLISPLFQY